MVPIQHILIRKPVLFPGNEAHCSEPKCFCTALNEKFAHSTLYYGHALAKVTTPQQYAFSITQPASGSVYIQVANSSFLRCTFCPIPLVFFGVFFKRNCFISPSVTKVSCTCRSFSPVWADEVTSPPCMTRGYFLLESPLSSPLSPSASPPNSQLPLGDEYIKGLVGD